MGQQVGGAAIDGLLGNDMLTGLGKCLNGIGDSCCAGCHCQTGYAAFQCGNSLLKYILRGVGKTTVDVAGVCQTEAIRRMLGVVEHIRSRCIDGNGTGIGYGIGLLLTNVELQGFKFILRHNNNLFLLYHFIVVFLILCGVAFI